MYKASLAPMRLDQSFRGIRPARSTQQASSMCSHGQLSQLGLCLIYATDGHKRVEPARCNQR